MGIAKNEKLLRNRLFHEVNTRLGSYVTFNKNCIIETLEQSFFRDFKLFSIIDFSCIPVSKLIAADNGEQSILLCCPLQWENLLNYEKINLNIKNVFEYLKLYYSTFTFPLNYQKIVESIDDIDFTEFPEPDTFESITRQIQAPVVMYSNNQFTIYCCLTSEQSLFNAAFDIAPSGKVVLLDKKVVLQNLPIGELVIDV